ncbi:hypothetical protein SOCE26_101520 [Sorangium cellulosum]|uniref:Uncharacterized protein n=1 Tax=Sorangium cellulosum TaxID=56 RepID=A0A2L0FAP3_SORCE|nr:hypothetical protein [Sorangium cellulosum]AUX48613.1 hypothetical protein SOCE26_101520 [Sorangium cellulosum]
MSGRAPGERGPGAARGIRARPGGVVARRALVAAALLAAALLAPAGARPAPERGGAWTGAAAALAGGAPGSAAAPGRSQGEAPRSQGEAPAPPAPIAAVVKDGPLERGLQRWPLRALRLTGKPADGRFEATLALGAAAKGEGPREVKVRLAPAQKKNPLAFRRPLAFYRLARALGAHVVPAAAARRIGIGELAALIGREPAGRKLLRRFVVMNDGTVDALVLAPAPGPPGPRWIAPRRTSIRFDDAPELDVWARWARSPSPARGERASILRDYLEVLVLDYLAGNGLRKEIVLDVSAGALSLEANASAFPPHVKVHALDRQLDRLAAAARFPRALRDALARFGPEEAAAALRPRGFEGELVPPRALVELEERRQTLLSLIGAKIAARGEAAVLSL